MFDLTPEAVVETNRLVGENGIVVKPNELHSAFASLDYYETDLEKFASVVRSVMQNHPFADGNKRTGVFLLIAACDVLGIPNNHSDDDWVEFAVNSVTQRWSVVRIVEFVHDGR